MARRYFLPGLVSPTPMALYALECRAEGKFQRDGVRPEWSCSAALGFGSGPSFGTGLAGNEERGTAVMKTGMIAPIVLWVAATTACSSSPAAPGITVAEAANASPSVSAKSATSADANDILASAPILVGDQVDGGSQRGRLLTQGIDMPV